MRQLVQFTCAVLCLGLAACNTDTSQTTTGPIDQAVLNEYRAAIPNEVEIVVKSPQPSMAAKLGDPATFPHASNDVVMGINGSIKDSISMLRSVTALEPTLYNTETKEFFWGPYPNDNGFGTVGAYVKRANGDFKYEYAFLRGVDNDIAKMKPVFWGGTTPDPNNSSHKSGVILQDYTANDAFEAENNPNYSETPLNSGRIVIEIEIGIDEQGHLYVRLIIKFGKVQLANNPNSGPKDGDYLYGQFDDGTNKLDYLDYTAALNVDYDPAKALPEEAHVNMAFLNDGVGRAEISVTGGNLGTDIATGVECWGKAIEQTYLTLGTSMGPVVPDEGTVDMCGPLFSNALQTLGITNLYAVDPALMAKLNDLAVNGIPKP